MMGVVDYLAVLLSYLVHVFVWIVGFNGSSCTCRCLRVVYCCLLVDVV